MVNKKVKIISLVFFCLRSGHTHTHARTHARTHTHTHTHTHTRAHAYTHIHPQQTHAFWEVISGNQAYICWLKTGTWLFKNYIIQLSNDQNHCQICAICVTVYSIASNKKNKIALMFTKHLCDQLHMVATNFSLDALSDQHLHIYKC